MSITSAVPDISDRLLNWQPASQRQEMPEADWLPWLLDSGSLTQLLLSKSDNQFRVQVESEAWINIDCPALASKFGPVSESHRFWSRKVILYGRGRPWVQAHTLVPEHSLFSPLRQLMQLRDKPLGEYLFSHPELQRSAIELSPFYESADENPSDLVKTSSKSWGRRSLFFLFGKPIMVAEFFLQQLLID